MVLYSAVAASLIADVLGMRVTLLSALKPNRIKKWAVVSVSLAQLVNSNIKS